MANINSKDNYDIPTNMMIGSSEDGSDGLSHQLKNKLVDYKKNLANYILPVDRKKVEIGIDTENPPKNDNNENWEVYNFFHRPLVASITILSKLKNDVKNAESTVVDYLLKQVDEGSLKFDTVAAKVVPQSNYVLLGEEYKADLFLAAFNKTKNPEIQVGSSRINVERGLGKYNVRTSKEGIVNYSGVVKVVAPSGKEMVFPFKSEYIVARPALTVSADKMNVFYAGLDNPVSVSVPGIPNERLSVSIDNGKINPIGNGKYSVTVMNGTQANVAVMATMENGEKRKMGISTFRVKRIPNPKTRYAKLTEDGSLTKQEILANPGIIAYYESFEFNANPKVKSFKISIISNSSGVEEYVFSGNMFDTKLQGRILKLRRGELFYISDVYAIGPDTRTVKLNNIMIKVR
jgi:gliding motility-associated protein GldM